MSLRLCAVAAPALLLALGAGAARADEAACKAFAGRTLPSSLIGLPTTGAKVNTAVFAEGKDGGAAFCRLVGEIAPVDPQAPKINFQVNLPEGWNAKAVQFGGGGLNGTLVNAEGPVRDQPPGPGPLQKGYVTFGTDAGHQNQPGQDIQTFALNDEALENHAYAAYKKVHDVALALTSLYYGKRPSRTYFFGGSEGGREALSGAQRFPADYDGIISTVPVLSWIGVQFGGYGQWRLQRAGGWMDADKIKLIQDSAAEACDADDGIKDGVIARYGKCDASRTLKALRCADGKEGDRCLSDAQIGLASAVRSPVRYGYAISHAETDYPGYSVGGEAFGGNYVPTILTAKKPAADDMARNNYAVGDVRYFFLKDPNYSGPLDANAHKARIQQVSRLMDMTDPDLSKFYAHGGKLIMKSNAADYLVAPASIWRYYDKVVATMGKARAERFIRLYVAPQTGHGGQGASSITGEAVPDKVDLLSELDAWVESGKAPADQLTLTNYSKEGQAVRAWPLCRYPNYPRYKGAGDAKSADSYRCVSR